jgi:hypothetical protein
MKTRLFLTLLPALFCGFAQAQTATVPNAAQQATAIQNAPTNAVTQAAVQQGVFTCAGRINQVTSFLGYTPKAGVLLMTPPTQPDQRLIPLVMELPTDGGSAYVVASFAPNQANGCGATYDAVSWWPNKCDSVATAQFPTLKNLGQLRKDVTVLDGGAATKVFLMPAGSGCLSIKKEVVL